MVSYSDLNMQWHFSLLKYVLLHLSCFTREEKAVPALRDVASCLNVDIFQSLDVKTFIKHFRELYP